MYKMIKVFWSKRLFFKKKTWRGLALQNVGLFEVIQPNISTNLYSLWHELPMELAIGISIFLTSIHFTYQVLVFCFYKDLNLEPSPFPRPTPLKT